jgi:hypothetical protein
MNAAAYIIAPSSPLLTLALARLAVLAQAPDMAIDKRMRWRDCPARRE